MMWNIRHIGGFIGCIIWMHAGLAQPLQMAFKTLKLADGLSDNTNVFVHKDRLGFVWMSSLDGLNRFDGLSVNVYKPRPDDPHSLLDNHISSSFFEDEDANLWFTSYTGIHRYNRSTDNFDVFRLKQASGEEIAADYYAFHLEDHSLWVRTGTGEAGRLHLFDIQQFTDTILAPLDGQRSAVIPSPNGKPQQLISTFFPYRDGFDILSLGPTPRTQRLALAASPNGIRPEASRHALAISDTLVWVVMDHALLAFNPQTLASKRYDTFAGTSVRDLWSITGSGNHLFLASRQQGIWVFDQHLRRFVQHIARQPDRPLSFPFDGAYDLYLDEQENLWVSRWQEGLAYGNLRKQKFSTLLAGASSTAIYEAPDGARWCGTSKGLYVFDSANSLQFHSPHWKTPNGQNGKGMIEFIFEGPEGQLWALAGNHLLKWKPGSRIFREVWQMSSRPYDQLSTREGHILLATAQGIIQLRPEGPRMLEVPLHMKALPPQYFSTELFEDQQGRLFVAENRNNLYVLGPSTSGYPLLHHFTDLGDITAFYQDSVRGDIWMSSSIGLYHLPKDHDSPKLLTDQDGIPNEYFSQLTGYQDQLWLGGHNGLIQFIPDSQKHIRYTPLDGLADMRFTLKATHVAPDGAIWMGTVQGINLIRPDKVQPVSFPPQIQLTGLWIDDQQIDTFLYLDRSPTLEQSYKHNTLSFEFTALEYSDASRNHFQYRLKGYEPNWVPLASGRKGFVRYPNLPPGRYTFQIMAANGDGVWTTSPSELAITISPPIWQRWWFRALIMISVAAIAWGLYLLMLNRRLAQAEAQRLRELDEFKNRLYANITHEFRTPLTVIMGMIEEIPEQTQVKSLIHRNSQQLLTLINQLMDLAKLESGKMELLPAATQVSAFLTYLTDSFKALAAHHQVDLQIQNSLGDLVMDVDEEKLHQILSNLLSNAIKFSPEGGKVQVQFSAQHTAAGPWLEIGVQDEGQGILPEQLPYIFDRFYQADNSPTRKQAGTGIGLALTRELVQLMGGEIRVESKIDEGSLFQVRLPIQQKLSLEAVPGNLVRSESAVLLESNLPETRPALPKDVDAPILLIIEDNPDVVRYLQSCLADAYHLAVASDGQAGIEKAIEIVPDIIISDVMMPKKDGFEVCSILKQDERTSHIPIILLTARSSQADKMAGLEHGADAYLAKPFYRQELFIRLQKLIELRKQLQTYYAGSPPATAIAPSASPIESAFLHKIRAYIDTHLGDSELEVPQLCEAVHLSYTQVYRKLKALTDQTPSQYIRQMRLQKGRELLQSTDQTVSEIAYDVGFSDPNYFSRAFSKAFGQSPSAMRGN